MKTDSAPRVECPGCGAGVIWSADFPHRPFCSQRCKDSDFIGWANEDKRMAGAPEYDDIFSEGVDSDGHLKPG